MSSPAATPSIWNDSAQWQLQHSQQPFGAPLAWVPQAPAFCNQDFSFQTIQQQQQEQLMQVLFQVQRQVRELQQDAVRHKIRQASAARPQRREREEAKRAGQRSHEVDEHGQFSRSAELPGSSSDEGRGRRRSGESSLLRLILMEVQSQAATALADKEDAQQEALNLREAASQAQEMVEALRAEKVALEAGKRAAEVELERRMAAMTAEYPQTLAELKSLEADLHQARASAQLAEDDSQARLLQLEGTWMKVEELQACIEALQSDHNNAQARALRARAECDATQQRLEAAQQETCAVQGDADKVRLECESAQAARDAMQIEMARLSQERDAALAELAELRQECAAGKLALADAQIIAEAACSDAASACAERQRAETAAQAESLEKDRVQQRLEAVVLECMCPIRHSMFRDPVVAADGHSYERQAIQYWLNEHDTSPLTGARLANRTVLPNRVLAKVTRLLRSDIGDDASSEASGSSSANPQEEPPVTEGELWRSARQGNRTTRLALLRRGVPDINLKSRDLVRVCKEGSVYQRGSVHELRTAGLIFTTVLHLAALQGWEDVCRAILEAPGFTEAHATVGCAVGFNLDPLLGFNMDALRLAVDNCPGLPGIFREMGLTVSETGRRSRIRLLPD